MNSSVIFKPRVAVIHQCLARTGLRCHRAMPNRNSIVPKCQSPSCGGLAENQCPGRFLGSQTAPHDPGQMKACGGNGVSTKQGPPGGMVCIYGGVGGGGGVTGGYTESGTSWPDDRGGGYTESGTSWPDDRGGGYRGLHGVGD